jgi:hypothetical protein
MGLTGPFEDEQTGFTLPNAYVSLYQANITFHKLKDSDVHCQYADDPSLKPQGWDEAGGLHNSGHWQISALAKVYATQAARQSDKNNVTYAKADIFVDDPASVTTAIYEKLKETYPSLEDC